MITRKELRAQRRDERLAREAAQRQRRRTVRLISAAAAVVIVAGLGVGIAVGLGGGGPASPAATTGPAVDLATLPGLQATAAPWQPEYGSLPVRLAALALPPNGDEAYHIHAHLAVFVDGTAVTVPANVGISTVAQIESPMHTHDTSGVIHIEASAPSDAFTLGAFFDIWGVRFDAGQLGSYRDGGGRSVQVYVNGRQITDPARYVLQPHDDIVVGYGAPGSFPQTVPYAWPPGE